MYDENNEFDENFEIEWRAEIFCIHSDFLIPYSSINKNYSEVDEHYFSNYDCDRKLNNLKESTKVIEKINEEDEYDLFG